MKRYAMPLAIVAGIVMIIGIIWMLVPGKGEAPTPAPCSVMAVEDGQSGKIGDAAKPADKTQPADAPTPPPAAKPAKPDPQINALCERVRALEGKMAAQAQGLDAVKDASSWWRIAPISLFTALIAAALSGWLARRGQSGLSAEVSALRTKMNKRDDPIDAISRPLVTEAPETSWQNDIARRMSNLEGAVEKLKSAKQPPDRDPPSPQTNWQGQGAEQRRVDPVQSAAADMGQIEQAYRLCLTNGSGSDEFDMALRQFGELKTVGFDNGQLSVMPYGGATSLANLMGVLMPSGQHLVIMPSREFARGFSNTGTVVVHGPPEMAQAFDALANGTGSFNLVKSAMATGGEGAWRLSTKGMIEGYVR